MDREKVIEKIQKLLNLAGNNPSEEEAQTALKMAHSLLRKFNMEMSDVELQEEVSDMTTEEAMEYTRNYAWILTTSNAIDIICDTKHFMSGGGWKFRMHFCGTKIDVATAKELFKFLYATIQSMGKAAKMPGIKERNSYCNGVGQRILQRAKEIAIEEAQANVKTRAVVHIKDQAVEEYVKEKHDLRTAKTTTVTKDTGAFMMGMIDGGKVPLQVSKSLPHGDNR